MSDSTPPTPQPLTAPFPYFGGKRRAAPIIWGLLGDPGGYVEPFAGSAAVLLARPPFEGRRVETLNDADGWLVNTWRAIRDTPGEVAAHAAGPITEIDYHARLAWLHARRGDGLVSWLEGDPEVSDAKAAAWWLYVMACGIGNPLGGSGPWRVIDGRLTDTRELPHLGDAGRGITRGLPHLGDAGQGITRELPHLGNAGQRDALTGYMRTLADRLTYVRITCGDWRRVTTNSTTKATATNPHTAIFLDPPYATSGDLYAHGNNTIAGEVNTWLTTNPLPAARIVIAGYDTEHDNLLDHGWTKHQSQGGSGSGYSTNPKSGRREQLWASPTCPTTHHQPGLF